MADVTVISTETSKDGKRRAVILKVKGVYCLDTYENDVHQATDYFPDKTLRYVEDAAENYCNYIP
jgi:hypothetical protein